MECYSVRVNNKQYKVEFENNRDASSIKEVFVNGEKMDVDVNMDTLCSIVVDNNTHKINGVYDYDGELVKLLIGKDYHSIEVEEFRPIKKENGTVNGKKKEQLITAPMPGKIISIDAVVGDLIKKGQDLLTLEAMKMENRIISPIDGVLKSINTSVGANCNSRDLLMVIG